MLSLRGGQMETVKKEKEKTMFIQYTILFFSSSKYKV